MSGSSNSYNVSGGAPPYTVFIIRSGDFSASVLHTLPNEATSGMTASWGVDIAPGTSITFVAKDNLGGVGYSVPIVVQLGNSTSCLCAVFPLWFEFVKGDSIFSTMLQTSTSTQHQQRRRHCRWCRWWRVGINSRLQHCVVLHRSTRPQGATAIRHL